MTPSGPARAADKEPASARSGGQSGHDEAPAPDGELPAQLLAVQTAAGNRAATTLVQRRRAAGDAVVQRNGPRGRRTAAVRPEPVLVSATTYGQAAVEAATWLDSWPGSMKILVADGVEAALFNRDGARIPGARTSFTEATTLPAGVTVRVGRYLRPLVRYPDGRLQILTDATLPGPPDLHALLQTPEAITRHIGDSTTFIVVPGGATPEQEPAPAREPVPDFLRPENAEYTANTAAYPATFQMVQPQTGMGAVNATSTFHMFVEKAQGYSLLEQATNVMQPMNFVWHVVKVAANSSTQVGRWAAQAASFSRRVRHIAEDVEGNLEGIEDSHPMVQALRAYNEVSMAGLRTTLAVAGEVVHMFARALIGSGDPRVEDYMDVPWSEPGLYLVKCTATPVSDSDAAVRRASSVAGALVFVADIASMAEEALPSVPEERRAIRRRLSELQREVRALRQRQARGGLDEDEHDRLGAMERAIEDLQTRLGAVGDERATRQAELASIDRRIRFITDLGELASESERDELAHLRERRQQLSGTLARADERLGLEAGSAQLMPAVRVDDATAVEQPLTFAVHHTEEPGNRHRVQLADVTDSRGGVFQATRDSLAAGWQAVLRDMRENLDRGRGWLRFRPPAPYASLEAGVPNPMRLRMSRGEQLRETVEDTVTAASVVALLAAPFTGGASLAVLVPLAVAGAAASGYRLARRVEYSRFELDVEAVSDMINIATLGLGRVSQMERVGRSAGRLGLVFGQRGVAARVLEGGEYLAMTTQLWGQLSAPSTGDPREDQRRRLLALLGAAQTAGLKVAPHVWPQGSGPPPPRPRERRGLGPEAAVPAEAGTPAPAGGTEGAGRPPRPPAGRPGDGGGGGGRRPPTAEQRRAARQFRDEADRLERWADSVDPEANRARIERGEPPELGRRYRRQVDMTPERARAEAERLRRQARDFEEGRANPLEGLDPDAISQALGDLENAPAQPRPELRQQYEEAVRSMSHEVMQRRINGESAEAIARWAHAERRRIGERYKDMTPPEQLAQIRERNQRRYGDPLGPTVEYLRRRGNTWEDIISSSLEAGGRDLPFTRGGPEGTPSGGPRRPRPAPDRPLEPGVAGTRRIPRPDASPRDIDAWLRDPATPTTDILHFWFAAGHWGDVLRYIARSVSDDGNARLQAARQELFNEARAHTEATVEGASIHMPGSARGARSDMDPTMRGPTTLRAVAAFRDGMHQALARRGLPTRGWSDVLGINPYTDPRLAEFRIQGTDAASASARQRLTTSEYQQLQIQHRERLMRQDPTGDLWRAFVRSQLDHVARTFGDDPGPRERLAREFQDIERSARADEQQRLRAARELEPQRLGGLSDEALLAHLRSEGGAATSREVRRRMLADAEAELQRLYEAASDPPTLAQREAILEQTRRVKALEEEAYQPSAIESVVEGQQEGHQARLERGEQALPLSEMTAEQRQNALVDSANMLEDHLPAALHALERGVPVNQAFDPVAKYLGRVLIEARELGIPVGQRNRVLGALARRMRARVGQELGEGGGPERQGATMTEAEAGRIVTEATELGLLESNGRLRDQFLTETLALLAQLRTSVSTRRAMDAGLAESMRPEGAHPWRRADSPSEPAEEPSGAR